ncbi:MAG: efflux RND transporter periplasmic adaptor subunit [Thermoguttaceae bacterium]
MNTRTSGRRWALAIAALCVIAAATTAGRWLPAARRLANAVMPASSHAGHGAKPSPKAGHDSHEKTKPEAHEHAGEHGEHDEKDADADHDHEADADHDHEHGEAGHKHDEAATVRLSPAAQKNIGLRLAKVELTSFERTMTVPGMVIERPGWSDIDVTSPMTGVVTRIYPIQGEAVRPGQPLFEVRLTHEDLLQAQTEFLKTVEELDVIGREVARLEKVTAEGAIAGKTLLERTYERQKQEAALRAQRQALLLHGLSNEQVDNIVKTRTLLQSLTIVAPDRCGTCSTSSSPSGKTSPEHPLQVQQLRVVQGKHVAAGDTLCTLADYCQLYIEGKAFEQDIRAVSRTAAEGGSVSAVLESSSSGQETIRNLKILYLDDKIDKDTRAFQFFGTLPNRLVRENKTPDGRRFVSWQFKLGQRTQLRIPVERWPDRIVLPLEAVAQDGAEAYVFEANGEHFERRPVHVEYRDQDAVVIANDGVLTPGKMVIVAGAYMVHTAMKNKAGGGVDPHAGHNH